MLVLCGTPTGIIRQRGICRRSSISTSCELGLSPAITIMIDALVLQVLLGAQLMDLDLSQNLITVLPTWLSRQHRLQRLVLGGNNIKYLPRTLAHCSKLRHLDLSCNTQLQVSGRPIPPVPWPPAVSMREALAKLAAYFDQAKVMPHEMQSCRNTSTRQCEERGMACSPSMSKACPMHSSV